MGTDDLIKIVRRTHALETLLKEGEMDRHDFEQALGVSKPTVHRFTRSFGEQGFIVRVDGLFRLTPLGEVVAEEAIRFHDTIEGIQKLRQISQWMPVDAFDFDVRRFHDADIILPDCNDPLAPIREAAALLDHADRVRVVSSTYIPKTFAALSRSISENDTSVTCTYDSRVVDVIRGDEQARSNLERLLTHGAVITTYPEIPFTLGIADETVLISAIDDGGALQALVMTDDSAVKAWAEETCQEFLHKAEPITIDADADTLVVVHP